MFPVLTTLVRLVSRGPVLLRTTLALLASGTLLLVWGLFPPPPGIAAPADLTYTAAAVAQPLSTITWGSPSSFGEPDFDNIPSAVHPTDPLRALVGVPSAMPS